MSDELRYCGHCQADTAQEVHDSNHERDSSGDWRRCTVCGWEYYGLTGRWHAPDSPLSQEEGTAQVKQAERDGK